MARYSSLLSNNTEATGKNHSVSGKDSKRDFRSDFVKLIRVLDVKENLVYFNDSKLYIMELNQKFKIIKVVTHEITLENAIRLTDRDTAKNAFAYAMLKCRMEHPITVRNYGSFFLDEKNRPKFKQEYPSLKSVSKQFYRIDRNAGIVWVYPPLSYTPSHKCNIDKLLSLLLPAKDYEVFRQYCAMFAYEDRSNKQKPIVGIAGKDALRLWAILDSIYPNCSRLSRGYYAPYNQKDYDLKLYGQHFQVRLTPRQERATMIEKLADMAARKESYQIEGGREKPAITWPVLVCENRRSFHATLFTLEDSYIFQVTEDEEKRSKIQEILDSEGLDFVSCVRKYIGYWVYMLRPLYLKFQHRDEVGMLKFKKIVKEAKIKALSMVGWIALDAANHPKFKSEIASIIELTNTQNLSLELLRKVSIAFGFNHELIIEDLNKSGVLVPSNSSKARRANDAITLTDEGYLKCLKAYEERRKEND